MQWLIIITDGSKTLLCSSKSPWASQRISSKLRDNLGTRPQKVSPTLVYPVQKSRFDS